MAEQDVHLPPARYEHEDVSFSYLATGLLGTLATLLLCIFLVMWLYPSAVVDRRLAGPLPDYPAPKLQVDPTSDLRQFVATEMAQLNSAGWTDRTHGVAHIPIDEAMQRIAQQGIPDWPTSGGGSH